MRVMLTDQDPRWERHSGKDLHRGTEWQDGDVSRAAVFYGQVSQNARLILDVLMDHPGELIDVDRLASQIREPRPGEGRTSHRRTVSGSLSAIRDPVVTSERRAPFYWWAGQGGAPSQYAMKPEVAKLFSEARRRSTVLDQSSASWNDPSAR
jgi:hypothetical protein